MERRLTIYFVRAVFLLICAGLAVAIGSHFDGTRLPWILIVSILVGGAIIWVEALSSKTSLRTLSAVIFGLLIGFALSALFSPIIEIVVESVKPEDSIEDAAAFREVKALLQLIVSSLFCYFGVTLLLQTQGQFQLLVPYVEFRREIKGLRPILVDTSAVLDGNLAGLVASGFFESRLVIPDFVANEIQQLADSGDARRRHAGERGLQLLANLTESGAIEVQSYPRGDDRPVDERLLSVARSETGRILTRDQKLQQRASLEEISTIYLPDVLEALRPLQQVGDRFDLDIVRTGEEKGQGVGYLPDGTLVVVDGAHDAIGERLQVEVRRVVPTQSGRLLFARVDDKPAPE